jgi:hypothetical protein
MVSVYPRVEVPWEGELIALPGIYRSLGDDPCRGSLREDGRNIRRIGAVEKRSLDHHGWSCCGRVMASVMVHSIIWQTAAEVM